MLCGALLELFAGLKAALETGALGLEGLAWAVAFAERVLSATRKRGLALYIEIDR